MQRYLLFDSGCAACTRIAQQVAAEANGWLTVKGLNDPEMRRILDRHRPGWSFRPTLIVVDDENVRIFTGTALSIRIAKALGVRRAARIARLVAGSDLAGARDAGGPTRRSLLKSAGAGAAALVGLALTPKAAAASSADDGRVLTGDELAKVLGATRADRGYQDLLAEVGGLGFATDRPETVALRGADGTTVVLSFFASASAVETTAALVAHQIKQDGSTSSIAELITRDSLADARTATAGLDALTVRRIASSEPQPMDAAAYFACMLGCVGVTCSGPASNCIRIPNLAAALACIAAVCGFRAYRCHATCRHAW